ERTRVLLHLVDITAPDPIEDYEMIQQELAAYGRDLLNRPQIVALNKMDACDRTEEEIEAIGTRLSELSQSTTPIFQISAVSRQGLDPLLQEIWTTIDRLQEERNLIHNLSL
ncbi:MAG TPA: hypothetical protein V6D27_07420, partial [Vampirovibrionales bacterium]